MTIKSVSPVLDGYEVSECKFVSGDGRFDPMTAVRLNEEGDFVARYELTDEDVALLLETYSIYLVVHTRGRHMNPVTLLAEPPRVAGGEVEWPKRSGHSEQSEAE